MTEKETVTAREDQPQKLPIDRPCSACSAGDYDMEYHDHHPPFSKRVDQPRPTLAQSLQEEAAQLHARFRHHTRPKGPMTMEEARKLASGEAQGEAPQPDAGQGVTYLTCGHCGKETMYDAREVMEITSKSLMETGAHPSQDALDSSMSNQDAYRLGLIARDAAARNSRTGAGDEIDRGLILLRLLKEKGFNLVKSEARARSTPSLPAQDARSQIDKDETIIALVESHANWVARAETAEAELAQIKEHCISEHDCTFCGGSTPSPDQPPEK